MIENYYILYCNNLIKVNVTNIIFSKFKITNILYLYDNIKFIINNSKLIKCENNFFEIYLLNYKSEKYKIIKKNEMLKYGLISKINKNSYFDIDTHKVKNYNCLPKNVKEKYEKFYLNNYLFPNYYLEISKSNDELNYNCLFDKVKNKNNKLWCQIHCFNIDNFDNIYGKYINNILKYFSVIVTYSFGEIIPSYDLILLKIPNIGMDIGSKIISLDYLLKHSIEYDYILFLHSKSNPVKREVYFNPFIKSLKQINYICSILYQYDIIFPNLLIVLLC